MLKWISEIKHRKLIRAAEREKELLQVMCHHEYKYGGNYEEYYYNGCDTGNYTCYVAHCEKCGKTVKSDNYNTLKVKYNIKSM